MSNSVAYTIAGIVFLIALVLFVTSFFFSYSNGKIVEDKMLLPFSGFIGSGNSLSRRDGTPQLSCPTGKKVSILGGFYEVYDPYGECGSSATSEFQKSCNSYTGGCDWDSKCPGGNGPYQACQCSNIDKTKGYTNCTCTDIKNNCKVRDISAYLASQCNGQNSCPVSLDSSNLNSLYNTLGPLPCNILPTDQLYQRLPFLPGNPGIKPGSGEWTGDAKPLQPSTNQGYYIHGVFACI